MVCSVSFSLHYLVKFRKSDNFWLTIIFNRIQSDSENDAPPLPVLPEPPLLPIFPQPEINDQNEYQIADVPNDSDHNSSENEETLQVEIPNPQPGPSTAIQTPAVIPKIRRSSSEPTLTELHPQMKSVTTKRIPHQPRTTKQFV